jgi:hypothetical protein
MTGLSRNQGILTGYLLFTFGIIYLYLHKEVFHNFVDSWNEYFEGALILPQLSFLPSISLLDFVGTTFVCKKYRETARGDKSWFEMMLACVLMQFGGTLIISLILGQPPSWLLSRSALPAFFLAWWLSFYSPDDIFWNTVSKNNFLLFLLGFLNFISSGHAVTSWGMDKCFFNVFHLNGDTYSRAYWLCILCGTVAACGGGILAEVFNFFSSSKSFTLRHKSSFLEIGKYGVSQTLNRSFWLALIYYILISSPEQFLPISCKYSKVTGHSIIALLQMSSYLMLTHIPDMDIYQEFSHFLLDTCNVTSLYSFGDHGEVEVEQEKEKNE